MDKQHELGRPPITLTIESVRLQTVLMVACANFRDIYTKRIEDFEAGKIDNATPDTANAWREHRNFLNSLVEKLRITADAPIEPLQAPPADKEATELLTEAEKFITGFANSAESGFVRQRKALDWLRRYAMYRGGL